MELFKKGRFSEFTDKPQVDSLNREVVECVHRVLVLTTRHQADRAHMCWDSVWWAYIRNLRSSCLICVSDALHVHTFPCSDIYKEVSTNE